MNPSLVFILVTIFLDAVGIGLVFPILPSLLKEHASDPQAATRMFGWFISLYALMQFLASPVLGALSDRFGRRPVLLLSLVGAGIDYLIMANTSSLFILFLGRIVAGLTGASMTVASSYVSDTSNDSNRASRFGYVNAAFGLGFVVGPAVGGWLGATFSTHAPFLAAAIMNLTNVAFGLFVLRESLPKEKRRRVAFSSLNPFRSLAWALRMPAVRPGLVVLFLSFLAGHVPPSIWAIYTGERYGWDTRAAGLSLSAYGICMTFSQAVLTGRLTTLLGERRTIGFGLATLVACFAGFGLAPYGWMIFPLLMVDSVASISGPVMQAQVSGHIPQANQGELQGTIVSLMSLASMLTPLLATQLHATFSAPEPPFGLQIPGIAFFAGAVLFLAAAVVHVSGNPASGSCAKGLSTPPSTPH